MTLGEDTGHNWGVLKMLQVNSSGQAFLVKEAALVHSRVFSGGDLIFFFLLNLST